MDRDKELELSSESFKQSSIREENNKEEEMDSVTSQNEENDEEEEMEQDTSRGSIGEENEEEEMDSVTSQDEENDKEEEIDSVTSRDEEEEETESDASHGSIDEENEEEEKHYTQCRRLYHCIHAVVAKIAERDDTKQEWAARRVKLLLDLIPSNPDFPLSEYQLVSLYGN